MSRGKTNKLKLCTLIENKFSGSVTIRPEQFEFSARRACSRAAEHICTYVSSEASAQQRGKPKCDGYKGGSIAVLKLYDVGFGLLEVMLALFILSFSLLALANFTTAAWRRTYDAYLSSLAVNLAANRVEAAYAQDVGQYSNVWQQEVAIILPQGQGSYTNKKSGVQVKVCWQQLFHKHKFCYTSGT